jgi:hypothetical protein
MIGMTRNRAIRWGAIPLHDDGREMMGTHGSVHTDGKIVLAHIVSGDYVSEANFVRFAVSRYGTPGVTYALFAGGFSSSARKTGTFKVPGEAKGIPA